MTAAMQQIILMSILVLLCSCSVDEPDTKSQRPLTESIKLGATLSSTKEPCGPLPKSFRQNPYKLSSFYQKHCDVKDIPIISSLTVNDEALIGARIRASAMLKNLDVRVVQAMVDSNTRISIMAESEVTTDIPEHSDLYTAFPNTDWDARARGLGATMARPASSAAEENLLCRAGDIYAGEDIFVHEFAHTIYLMGLKVADPNFELKLQEAYKNALTKGLWTNTYAAVNANEYWAEGIQSWFDANQKFQEGIHNHVNTRVELQEYDPELYYLIADYMPQDFRPECP